LVHRGVVRGPDRFTRELGFAQLIDVDRGLGITKAPRPSFVELYRAALDDVAGLPGSANRSVAYRYV
jgi:hypothetical protein